MQLVLYPPLPGRPAALAMVLEALSECFSGSDLLGALLGVELDFATFGALSFSFAMARFTIVGISP